MANPNKTVARARRAMGGFPPKPQREHSPFMRWFFEQVQQHGRDFVSLDQAKEEYRKLHPDAAE